MKRKLKQPAKTVFAKKDESQKVLKKLWANAARLPRSTAVVVAFAVVGSYLLFVSFASSSTSSIEPEDSDSKTTNITTLSDPTASGGAAIKFGRSSGTTVRRFFSDDASWNKTIAQMGGAEVPLKPYAYRLWDYGGGTFPDSAPPGTFRMHFKDYSVPIYDVKTATTTARLFQVGWSQNQQSFSATGHPIGVSVPWNPDWKPGTGNDRILTAVDYQTGVVHEFWVIGEPALGCWDFLGPNNAAGFDTNNPNHLCIAGYESYNNLWTAKDGSTIVGRGMGINKLALVVRADEVETGNIRHALPLTTANPMFGPEMVDPPNDPYQPGAGTTKGFFMKPATRLEHKFGTTIDLGSVNTTPLTNEQRAKTNPSGMRFGLTISEQDITAWLNARGYTGAKRQTATTLARAWRDYGAIIAETGGWGIGIETDGVMGPAKDKWAELGIPDIGTNTNASISFEGLITRERLYVVKQPN